MTIIIIRNAQGDIIEERRWRGGFRKAITATKGEQMNRKFGRAPFKNWRLCLSTEFGKVK